MNTKRIRMGWMSLVIVGAFSLPVAYAQVSTTTKYDELVQYFNQGRAVSFDQIMGVYTGRCYFKAAPDEVEIAVLSLDRIQTGQTNGPLFTKVTPVMGMGYFQSTITESKAELASRIDGMSSSKLIDELKDGYPDSKIRSESPVTEFEYSGGNIVSFTISHGFLMADVKNSSGSVLAVCYFFNKK